MSLTNLCSSIAIVTHIIEYPHGILNIKKNKDLKVFLNYKI